MLSITNNIHIVRLNRGISGLVDHGTILRLFIHERADSMTSDLIEAACLRSLNDVDETVTTFWETQDIEDVGLNYFQAQNNDNPSIYVRFSGVNRSHFAQVDTIDDAMAIYKIVTGEDFPSAAIRI